MSPSAFKRSGNSSKSSELQTLGATGITFALGARLGGTGFVSGEGATGVGAGVGFCAALLRAVIERATPIKVALIILPSF
jgi:hypothetical protein